VPGFDCAEPFTRSAERVVEVRAAELFEHAEGVLGTEDIEPLHDMRVATRRLRAVLETYAPCFPMKRRRKALRRVRRLADALGERRDRDVQLAFLHGVESDVADGDREALRALVETLRAEQRAANEALAPLLEPARLGELRRRLGRLSREGTAR
jgi:CHAD domain-containing protein